MCRVISRHKLVENHFLPIMKFYLGDADAPDTPEKQAHLYILKIF